MQCISCGESYERRPTDYNSMRCLTCRREHKRTSQRERQRELRGGESRLEPRDEADPLRSCWSCRHLDPDTITCEPGELAGHFPPAGPGQYALDCADFSRGRQEGVKG